MKDKSDILRLAIATYGTPAQEDMMLEEMSELTKAILKYRRLDETDRKGAEGFVRRGHIREEIADVQIMLDQMRIIYGDTSECESYKLERLAGRLGLE